MDKSKDLLNALFNEVFYKRLEMEAKYFELASRVSSNNKAASMLVSNIMKMSMVDQIKVLEILDKLGDISVSLCEKYGFCDEENIDE